jgi:CheY-like chemotaxis protein
VALLFTDVVLGGPMNGRALADLVQQERPGVPVLFTTGYTRDAIVRQGRVEEGIELIGKPFTSASLVAKVANLLTQSSQVAAAQ